MTVAAFVQARMGAQRLPGKSLLPIWQDMPLLELVLRRVRAAALLDRVVLVTSSRARDDPLVPVATRLGLEVFRGSEEDVLGRFTAALERHSADTVVRVCADNPFVDPEAIDALVTFYLSSSSSDYASNHSQASGLPDGIGVEVLAAHALRRAAAAANSSYDREHVCAYVLARPEEFRALRAPPPKPPWPSAKLDIDTYADYCRMRAVAELLPPSTAPLWSLRTVMSCYERSSVQAGARFVRSSSENASLERPRTPN